MFHFYNSKNASGMGGMMFPFQTTIQERKERKTEKTNFYFFEFVILFVEQV